MSAAKPTALTPAEVNHLRRLVAWVSCDIGQAPEEMVSTLKELSGLGAIGPLSTEAKGELVRMHAKAEAVPKYIRAAVKALRKTIAARPDGIEDAEVVESVRTALPGATRALPAPLADSEGGK